MEPGRTDRHTRRRRRYREGRWRGGSVSKASSSGFRDQQSRHRAQFATASTTVTAAWQNSTGMGRAIGCGCDARQCRRILPNRLADFWTARLAAQKEARALRLRWHGAGRECMSPKKVRHRHRRLLQSERKERRKACYRDLWLILPDHGSASQSEVKSLPGFRVPDPRSSTNSPARERGLHYQRARGQRLQQLFR